MSKFCFSIAFFLSLIMFSQIDKYNVKNTGVNMTVAILAVDDLILPGDTIVALYKAEGLSKKDVNPFTHPNDFLIAGLTIWKGNRLAIALWGNDSTSEMKDGFFNEENIFWAIVKKNQYLPIQLFYRVGQNTWEPNGIHIVDSIRLAS